MFSRTAVCLPVEDGTPLLARLSVPDGQGPFPAISIAHAFAAGSGIDLLANACAFAGFVVLLHAHRCAAERAPGWQAGIDFLRTLPEVDPARIGVWPDSGQVTQTLRQTDARLLVLAGPAYPCAGNADVPDLAHACRDMLASFERAFRQVP